MGPGRALITYWDTSALASLYLEDVHSPAAVAALVQAQGRVLLTDLHELEFNNAVQLRVFRRELGLAAAAEVRAAFASDRRLGRFAPVPLPPTAFAAAANIALAHTARHGLRSLDLLHLGAALELKADAFLTFDGKQRTLARVLGLALV